MTNDLNAINAQLRAARASIHDETAEVLGDAIEHVKSGSLGDALLLLKSLKAIHEKAALGYQMLLDSPEEGKR